MQAIEHAERALASEQTPNARCLIGQQSIQSDWGKRQPGSDNEYKVLGCSMTCGTTTIDMDIPVIYSLMSRLSRS